MRTGWPPGLLQDDGRWLSKWFASKPDARRLVRERCTEIESEHMNQHTEPEPTTDRELLEPAAKAAGWTWWRSKHGYWNLTEPDGTTRSACHGWEAFDRITGEKLPEPTPADALVECGFDPLADDGDALRLAVKLAESAPGTHFTLSISKIHDGRGFADAGFFSHINPTEQVVGPDLAAATRRAIVRAAAEIGKAMPCA